MKGAGGYERPGARTESTNARLPRVWLAKRAVAWSREARASGDRRLEAALLDVAAAAVDSHLAGFRAESRP